MSNDLLDTPAQVLRAFLIAPSGAVFVLPSSNTSGWPLYVSALPDGDGARSDAAALYDTSGDLGQRLLASGRQPQAYGIQLKSRAQQDPDGYNLLSKTARQLSAAKRQLVTLGANQYTIDTIRQTSPVISLGQDDRRRAMHSVNFLLMLIEA